MNTAQRIHLALTLTLGIFAGVLVEAVAASNLRLAGQSAVLLAFFTTVMVANARRARQAETAAAD